MHTLGYRFRPWTQAKAIADGPSILSYVRDTAAEAGIDDHIRFGHRVTRPPGRAQTRAGRSRPAHGSRDGHDDLRLPVHVQRLLPLRRGLPAGFAGIEQLRGQIVHPQHWPEDLDYAGKRVVVIGSGATAVTLVPAMAETAAHVTMLQRSPSYIVCRARRGSDRNRLRRLLGVRRALRAHALEERADQPR